MPGRSPTPAKNRSLWPWILGGVLAAPIMCCGLGAWIVGGKQEALVEGDNLYKEGKKAEAVVKYKEGYSAAGPSQKAEVLKRIVEFEVEKANVPEAAKWVEAGLSEKLEVAYDSPTAKALAVKTKKDRDSRLALSETEAKRKQEEHEARDAQAKSDRDKTRKRTRAEFKELLIGKTGQEVLDALGRPNRTQELGDMEYWYYEKRTTDPVSGKTDFFAQVLFEGGKVTGVSFN